MVLINLSFSIFGYDMQFGKKNLQKTSSTIFSVPVTSPSDTVIKINPDTLNRFSTRSIPRRAINLVKDGVLSLPYRIVPVNKNDKKSYDSIIKVVDDILKKPNEYDDYNSFFGAILEDTLKGDQGAAEIVFTNKADKPIEMYRVDGFSLEHIKAWYQDKKLPRFAQTNSLGKKVYLKDEDVFYLQKTVSNDTPFGLSPLESAFIEINYLLNAQSFAGAQANNNVPKKALNLGENVPPELLVAFRKYMREEVYGRPEVPIIGGIKGASTLDIGTNSDDGLYLEWQKFLITIIALCFNIDPKKLGQGSNTDRSTVQEQNEALLHEAIKPYALLIERCINSKIIERLGLQNYIKFEYVFAETLEQKKLRLAIAREKFESGGITLNEYRKEMDQTPLKSKYGDMIQPQLKSSINKDYAINVQKDKGTGGFNGVGKNRKENTELKKNEET